MKSYPEQCLERAEKATPLNWYETPYDKIVKAAWNRHFIVDGPREAHFHNGKLLRGELEDDIEFIAHARTDVPELARRLKDAIGTIAMLLETVECRGDEDCDHCVALQAVAELEAMPGEK